MDTIYLLMEAEVDGDMDGTAINEAPKILVKFDRKYCGTLLDRLTHVQKLRNDTDGDLDEVTYHDRNADYFDAMQIDDDDLEPGEVDVSEHEDLLDAIYDANLKVDRQRIYVREHGIQWVSSVSDGKALVEIYSTEIMDAAEIKAIMARLDEKGA